MERVSNERLANLTGPPEDSWVRGNGLKEMRMMAAELRELREVVAAGARDEDEIADWLDEAIDEWYRDGASDYLPIVYVRNKRSDMRDLRSHIARKFAKHSTKSVNRKESPSP